MSLSLGKMPENWKLANITPVFKKGGKGQCENYRPISLLCIASKVFERVIMNQIKNEITPLITPFQYGFLNGKSTETQLLHVYSFINDILNMSGRVDIIYLDFTKAFDSVPHHFLLHKLKSFGIDGVLYEWFCSYLTGRKQCAIIEGDLSDWCDVASGVPQGSILGPLLFLMYINDMVEELSESTNIALFADDAKTYSKIKSSNDHQALQRDLSKLEDWSNLWKLKFNSNKCKVLRMSRVLKHDSVYRMNDEILENVTSFNDLVVLITKDLDWQAHIHKKVSKANSVFAFIKRTYGYTASLKSKRAVYLALIRSSLLYCSVVWYPNRSWKKLIEGIQRRATKFITGDYDDEYKARLKLANLLPINYQRETRDLCILYKCIHGYYDIDIRNHVMIGSHQQRTRSSRDSYELIIARYNTEKALEFFFARTVKPWNTIPSNVRSINCNDKEIPHLRSWMIKHYNQQTESYFDVNNLCTWVSFCRCPFSSCMSTIKQHCIPLSFSTNLSYIVPYHIFI